MMKVLCLALLAFASLAQARLNLVLVGATGDLAQKYLYQALYEQVTMKTERKLKITPAATRDEERGQKIIDSFLVGNITCRDLDEEIEIYGNCKVQEKRWIDSFTPYRQLRTEDQYKALGQALEKALVDDGVEETGRLFYLSVPPKHFGPIAKYINKYVRPSRESAWLRVVFEKPFGNDLPSAKKLAAALSAELKEEEILRVDHYIGKKGMHALTDFRAHDQYYEKILNRKHVTHVEVAIHERIDASGRTGYFDDYGIIRDMAQNHLTEMAVRAAMDAPPPTGNKKVDQATFQKNRLETLDAMLPLTPDQSLVGQYEDYQEHVLDDLNERSEEEIDELPEKSKTATFFASVTEFDTDRWEGVPWVFSVGKDLPERYARVKYFMRGGEQVTFYLQGRFVGPAVLSTFGSNKQAKNKEDKAEKLQLKEGWDYRVGMLNYHFFQIGVFQDPRDPYWFVIDAALDNDRTFFIDTKSLLLSWEKWHDVVTKTEADMPFIYGITNSSDTIPTEHLTDTTGMVKQIYGKDYEPDTDYVHPSERPKPKVVEKPKVDDTPKPVMNKLKPKAQKPKADDQEAAAEAKDEDEEHLEL